MVRFTPTNDENVQILGAGTPAVSDMADFVVIVFMLHRLF